MRHEESNLQIQCVKWFRMQYPEPSYLIWATPNGEKRNAITGRILKAQGVRAGMPDITIATRNKIFFIEMKSEKGKLSESQREIQGIILDFNFNYYTCNSLDNFINICKFEL